MELHDFPQCLNCDELETNVHFGMNPILFYNFLIRILLIEEYICVRDNISQSCYKGLS